MFADMFKDATAMMRDAIAAKPEEFSAIIEAPSFKDHFTITGTKLKRVPKGYDPDHSMASYLCHKSWCLEYRSWIMSGRPREVSHTGLHPVSCNEAVS